MKRLTQDETIEYLTANSALGGLFAENRVHDLRYDGSRAEIELANGTVITYDKGDGFYWVNERT